MNTECCAVYSSDCKYLAYSSPDGCLKIWDTASGTLEHEYVPSSHLSAAATCLLWKRKPPKPKRKTPQHRKRRSRSSGSVSEEAEDDEEEDYGRDSDSVLALGTRAGSVLFYSVNAEEVTLELNGQHTAPVLCLAWDTTGLTFFSGSQDSHVVQWNMRSGRVKCKLKAGKTGVHALCPLPDGATLLTASRTIIWWDLASSTQLRSYSGHATEVTVLRHVPLPGLDGEGGYFISAAGAERVISAWQLTRDADHQAASVSFSVASEPRDVQLAPAGPAADGSALFTAVAADGALHVFERHLNGVRRKPVKPRLSVRVATGGAVARPLPVLAAAPAPYGQRPLQIHFCHGSMQRPVFERLTYPSDESEVVLVRADPSAGGGGGAEPAGRVKTPGADAGGVRQLAAGLLSTAGAARKRKASGADTGPAPAPAQLPMQQRLGALVAPPDGTLAKPPTAANMAQLLVQGLAGRDRTMLKTVLQSEDADVISSTVAALPLDSVLPFIDRLGYVLRFSDHGGAGLKWLRAVVERHSSFLLTQTDLEALLAPIYSSVQVRLRAYPRLLQLRGRLDLITGQVAARHRQMAAQSAGKADHTPLLSYQDDSSDDEGDLLGLPAPSPGDVSDMSDDDQHGDSADETADHSRMEEDGEDSEDDSEAEADASEPEGDQVSDDVDEEEDAELMNGD